MAEDKKSLFDGIDGRLMSITEKAVKYFNWLTGKDNFQLAYLVNFIGFSMILVMGIVNYEQPFEMLLIGLIPIAALCMQYEINKVRREKTKEQEKAAKCIELELKHRSRRLVSTTGSCYFYLKYFCFYLLVSRFPGILASDLSVGKYFVMMFWLIGIFPLMAIVAYVISVDRPPFAKSQAWELFKSTFTVRELVPVKASGRSS